MKSNHCAAFRWKRSFVWFAYFGIVILIFTTYAVFDNRTAMIQINEAISRMFQNRTLDTVTSREKKPDLFNKGSRSSIQSHRGKLSMSRTRPEYMQETDSFQKPIKKPYIFDDTHDNINSDLSVSGKFLPSQARPELPQAVKRHVQVPMYETSTFSEFSVSSISHREGLSPLPIKVLPRKIKSKKNTSVQAKTRVDIARRKQTASYAKEEYMKIKADAIIQRLVIDLRNRLENVLPKGMMNASSSCGNQSALDNSCDKSGCLRLQLPKSPESRIEQLVKPPHLHPSDHYVKVMGDMRDSVPGYYDIIFATAASSNHYLESKALLYNLKKNVFPYLKNCTLVYYDIGLRDTERADIAKVCGKACHMRTYPFSNFPKIFSMLKCFGWKPTMVYAHVSRCNLLFWVDASIRFSRDISKLKELLQIARVQGMQTGSTRHRTPWVTLKETFHFFGDEPCAYHDYKQCTAGVVVYKNEPLIRQAVIEPWVACALNESCMCPHNETFLRKAKGCAKFMPDIFEYAMCHRFDQSALTIIARKLFQEKSYHLMSRIGLYLSIRRGDKWVSGR